MAVCRPIIRAALSALAALAITSMSLAAGHAIPAAAATDHTALVVVDTGSTVDAITVHFSTDSITGRQALDLTGLPVVYRAYGSNGVAVCAIKLVGCSAGQDCLTCGGDHYWAYSHAKAGSSQFTTSSTGVSSSQVHDGDEEGWKWGQGEPPAYVQQGSSGPTSTSTTAASSGGTPTSRATAGTGASSAPTVTTPSGAAPTSTTASPGAIPLTPTTSVDAGGSTFAVADPAPTGPNEAASRSPRPTASHRNHDSSSLPGFIALAAVLAGLGALGLRARTRRRSPV